MTDKIPKREWQWFVVIVVLGCVLLITVPSAMNITSFRAVLQGWGVAAMDHPFMDLRGVAAWCEASNEGKDPSAVQTWIRIPGSSAMNPNFLMNYSPVVLTLKNIGLTQEAVPWWGIGLGLFYGLSVCSLAGSCTLKQALLWAFLFCSPASVLVMERGNIDILLFGLLVLALRLRHLPFVEALVILGASSIKFFPIVSLLALWKENKPQAVSKGRTAVILASCLFLIFMAALSSRLPGIANSLSGQYQTCFGSTTMIDLLAYAGILPQAPLDRIRMAAKIIALLLMVASFAIGLLVSKTSDEGLSSARALHAFFLASPILLGLFVLGPQMDYKWICFLFMVPSVLELAKSGSELLTIPSKCWFLLASLYSYWTFFSDEGSLRNALLKQMLMWSLMMVSAFLAGVLWNRKAIA
jgi:hypothetical protein